MEGGHRIDSMFLGRRPVGVLWNLTNDFQMIIKNIEENVINKEEEERRGKSILIIERLCCTVLVLIN